MNTQQITVLADDKQEIYSVIDDVNIMHKGTVVIKAVNCGKHCRGCPHKFYKYICWKQDGKTRWKYIGVVKKGGE